MKIAYLINSYPMVSLSFIRREIQALEKLGILVKRFSIRTWNDTLVDETDKIEAQKTQYILNIGGFRLILLTIVQFFKMPLAFLKALLLTIKIGRRSERGLLIHFIYLAESCVLKQWLIDENIDHLHVHFGSNPTTVAMLCEMLGGPGYSFTVHGPEDFDKVAAIALPEKIKRARFVVAISSYGRSQLYRWCDYQQWSKIHIVHCGLDRSFLETDPKPLPESPNLVCVGRLSEQKGQVLLLQAVAVLIQRGINLKLVLVGDGDLRPAIETAIAELKLQDVVEITGWATEQEVKAKINAAKAMILPSFAEGLPVVLMESLAMGRPVISTYIAGIPELIKPGVSGWLVPAGDIDALVDALQFLLKTPLPTLTQMGNNGRELVLRQHDVIKEAKILADLFAQYAQS